MQRKRDKALADSRAKDAEIERLRSQLQQPKSEAKKPPTLAGCNYDEEQYAIAKAEWDREAITSTVQQVFDQRSKGASIEAQQQLEAKALRKYSENAAKLGVSDFNAAQDSALDVLGDDFGQMLAKELPEDAPKIIYWLGKNPEQAAQYKQRFEAASGTATFELGKLAAQLTVKPRRSTAAEPDQRIEGEGAPMTAGEYNRQMSKIDKALDSGKMSPAQAVREQRRLKQEANQAQ